MNFIKSIFKSFSMSFAYIGIMIIVSTITYIILSDLKYTEIESSFVVKILFIPIFLGIMLDYFICNRKKQKNYLFYILLSILMVIFFIVFLHIRTDVRVLSHIDMYMVPILLLLISLRSIIAYDNIKIVSYASENIKDI